MYKEGDVIERSYQDLDVSCSDFKPYQRDSTADYMVCGMTLHNQKWGEDVVDP